MKNSILIVLVFCMIFSSCGGNKFQMRFYGYIYNSQDSLPFEDTQFKMFKTYGNSGKSREYHFSTNDEGYFDVTIASEFQSSNVAWPSYFKGAAYVGPPSMGASDFGGTVTWNEDRNLNIIYFDTLFTTPYH